MNPLTQTRNLTKLIEREIKLEVNENASWHKQYKDSAWLFIGGLDYGLNEGDIIAVFSQYGEVVNINLVRDKKTGKPKGYCFLCYEDQRSTVLAVDNFNGIKLCKRIIRVDHVEKYRVPKDSQDIDDETKNFETKDVAPEAMREDRGNLSPKKIATPVIKQERHDPGYDKNETKRTDERRSPITNSSTKKDSKANNSKDSKQKESGRKEKHDNRKESKVKDDDWSRNDRRHQEEKDDRKHDSRSRDRKRDDRESHDSRNKSDNRNYVSESRRDTNDKHQQRSTSELSKDQRNKRDRDEDQSHSHDHKHSRRKH